MSMNWFLYIVFYICVAVAFFAYIKMKEEEDTEEDADLPSGRPPERSGGQRPAEPEPEPRAGRAEHGEDPPPLTAARADGIWVGSLAKGSEKGAL